MTKIFDVNIDADEVTRQYAAEQMTPQKKKVTFEEKNYLNARLGRDEQTKTLTIRLLPFSPDGGTPFQKIYAHVVRVNKEVAPSGWKTFICPTHNSVDGAALGTACPFCDTSSGARTKRFEATDEVMKKKYNEIEFANRAREMWIVRCIERGKEDEGVKFWLFSHSKKKDGVYDKIMNIATLRSESAKKKGNIYSIFDLNNGMDLIITLTRTADGKTNIQVLDEGMPSPLSTSAEEGMKWIKDEKKWTDVYTVKNYDYMRIVAMGGIPYYDKDRGCYIDKATLAAAREEATKQRIEESLTAPTVDYSQVAAPQATNSIIDGTKVGSVPQAAPSPAASNPYASVQTPPVTAAPIMEEEEDLPF